MAIDDVLPRIDEKDIPPMPKVHPPRGYQPQATADEGKNPPTEQDTGGDVFRVPVSSVELVTVAMNRSDRLRIYSQITAGMLDKKLPLDYAKLHLGFDIPADWPLDAGSDVTLAKLVAVAAALGMKIEITDLNLIPL